MSINQVVSFLSMIQNSSRILHEKYTERLVGDESMEERQVNSSSPKKSIMGEGRKFTEEPYKIQETIKVFSDRYYQVPKKRIVDTDDVDEEDKDAIESKMENVNKLRKSVTTKSKHQKDEEMKIANESANSQGTNNFTFFLSGLNIFFINDYKDNSYPVMSLNLMETNYERENRSDGSFVSNAQLDASFDYYNIKNGAWEPFVEGLDIEFLYDRQVNSSVIQVKGKESINLNISPDFVAVMNYCWKSWNQAQKQLEKSMSVLDPYKDPQDIFAEEVKKANEEDLTGTVLRPGDRDTMFLLSKDDNVVDIATPYKVCNLTGSVIIVHTLFENAKEKYVLKNCQTAKIAISYDQQTHGRNYESADSKLSDCVKILFEGLNLPIEKISLNKVGQYQHRLTDVEDDQDNKVYYETKVIDMNKVLTLRTQNVLINSTQFIYTVVIQDPFSKGNDKHYVFAPGESIPFPRTFRDCKICIKANDDKEFSNMIPAKKLIFNTDVNHTNYIRSGKTFTMVRKEQNKTMKDCFDIHLIPPIRVRNGLPVMMQLSLVNQSYDFLLEKSEEKHVSFYSPEEIIQLTIKLDGYEAEPMPIKFLKKSYETKIKLISTSHSKTRLNLYANFSDDKAGCFITFYVKTCFINASSIPLHIYDTSKHTKGFYIPSISSWKNLTLASDLTN